VGVKDILKPLEAVFEPELDTAFAPSLGKVYGYIRGEFKPEKPADQYMLEIYSDPDKFFSSTYITEGMKLVFDEVIHALERGSRGLIILPSLFGGGKTHSLLALLHAFRKPEAILNAEPKNVAKEIYEKLKKITETNTEIVVVDGDYERYAPSPVKPLPTGTYTIRSIWGYIAYCLGSYEHIKEYDIEFRTPSVDSLENIFRGKQVVVMLDEVLSGYLRNLDREQRERFIEFFRRLAIAIQGKPVAVILTIPAEYQKEKGEVKVEKRYESVKDEIIEVARSQQIIISPVKTEVDERNEVVKILKKRIFGTVEINMPDKLVQEYQKIYSTKMSEEGRLFPLTAQNIELLREYYPFHPTYIDVLTRHISERKPELFQKTRFAILITRKAVRKIWRSDRNPDFIHIWSIDLEDSDISAVVLGVLEKDYKPFISKLYDVARKLSEPIIAKDLITAIFLRTFLYEGLSEAIKAYPTEDEVYWMVYDREYGVEPARLRKILNKLLEEPEASYISRDDREGRVYFTTLIDIIDRVKRRVEETLRRNPEKVYDKLVEELRSILTTKDEKHEPFSKEMVEFLTPEKLVLGYTPSESSSHRVIVYLGSLRKEEAEKLVVGYPQYKNTTVVLDTNDENRLEEILNLACWLYVIDDMLSKKELEDLYRDETARKVNEDKLKKTREGKLKDFKKLAPIVFRRVWYPFDNNVFNVETPTPQLSLLGNVYTALDKDQKILRPEEVNLDTFLKRLAEVGIDLRRNWRSVSSIVDVFLRNPRLWIANREMVLTVLKRLYNSLEIAVMREGRIYWKNICESEAECDGGADNRIEELRDNDQVAHSEHAYLNFVEQLLNEEKEEKQPDEITRTYYEILTEEGARRLRDLYKIYKERDQLDRLYTILKNTRNKLLIKKEVIERGFDLRIEPEYIEVKPNEEVSIKVSVAPVGDFNEEVSIETDRGVVEPSKGTPPFEAKWKLRAESSEGIYSYKVRASSGTLERAVELTVKVLGEYEVIIKDLSEYEPRAGDIIEKVIDIQSIGVLQNVAERIGDLIGATPLVYIKANGLENKLQLSIDDVEISNVVPILNILKEVKDLNIERAELGFKDAKPLNDYMANRLRIIKKPFSGVKVQVRRKRT